MFRFGSGFWMGFWAPVRSLRLIATSPRMLALVAVPLTVNILLYVLFFSYGSQYLSDLITAWTTHLSTTLPAWFVSVSYWGLKIIAWLALGLVAALTFTIVSGIVSAPFNDALSVSAIKARLRQREKMSAQASPPAPPRLAGHGLKLTLWLETKRMTVLIIGALIAMVIGLIPLLQLPALAMGSLLVSFEYFGYPISQRSASLLPVFAFTLRHPAVSLGFGSFLLLMMALPFTSLFYIPLAVVGGSSLYVDLQNTQDTSRK